MMKKSLLFLFAFFCLFLLPETGNAQSAKHKVIVPAYFFPYDNADPGQHDVVPNRKLYRAMHYGATPGQDYLNNPEWIHSVCERPIDIYPATAGGAPDVNTALQQVGYNQQLLQGKPASALIYQQSGLPPQQKSEWITARLNQQLRDGQSYSNLKLLVMNNNITLLMIRAAAFPGGLMVKTGNLSGQPGWPPAMITEDIMDG